MDELLLSADSKKRFDDYIHSPLAVVLICGSGHKTASHKLATALLGRDIDYALSKGEVRMLNGRSAGIDDVRQLIKSLNIKDNSVSAVGRLAIIQDVDGLGLEAQNALLKTLEEPSPRTIFILTADRKSSVLPTVLSRAAIITLSPVSYEESINFFGGRHNEAGINTAWRLSGGDPELLEAILNNSDLPLVKAVAEAKRFLRLPVYERLNSLSRLDRDQFTIFLDALLRVVKAAHHIAIKQENYNAATRLGQSRKSIVKLMLMAEANTSLKLLALELGANLTV